MLPFGDLDPTRTPMVLTCEDQLLKLSMRPGIWTSSQVRGLRQCVRGGTAPKSPWVLTCEFALDGVGVGVGGAW
jgi:hypothetical protein